MRFKLQVLFRIFFYSFSFCTVKVLSILHPNKLMSPANKSTTYPLLALSKKKRKKTYQVRHSSQVRREESIIRKSNQNKLTQSSIERLFFIRSLNLEISTLLE